MDTSNPSDPNARRSSDPCRPLDRQFGVHAGGGQIMSRHRSFSNLGGGGGQNARTPLHNQRIRGGQQAAGAYMAGGHQSAGQVKIF